jgi:outer membrane protein assembly factor BamB
VAGGRVYFGSFDGAVYALDARSGDLIWKHDTGAPVVSSPAVDGGHVLVGSRSYDLLALGAADGLPDWTFYYWFSWVESSATLHRGTAYVGSSDAHRLWALDLRTGERSWNFDTRGSSWAQPAVTDDAVYIGAVGVADYLVDHRGGFFAVHRDTGRARWAFPVQRPEGSALWGFASAPAVGGGLVFVGGLDGKLYAFPE